MKHIVITGGAGFIGSHLAERFINDGHSVTIVDDFTTGRHENIPSKAHVVIADVAHPDWVYTLAQLRGSLGDIDEVWHMASPCAPDDYQSRRMHTLQTLSQGTQNAIDLAVIFGARFVLASTSEVYGLAAVTPQAETYNGYVSPIGPRSCYDEGKRYAEALVTAAVIERGLDACIARIFNTYGPRMPDDGRAMSSFVRAAVNPDRVITIYGDGTQTRSFSYIDDTVEGLLLLAASEYFVANVGSDDEISINRLAALVANHAQRDIPVVHEPKQVDDPVQRKPDLTLLKDLGHRSTVSITEGIKRMMGAMYGSGAAGTLRDSGHSVPGEGRSATDSPRP